MGQPNVQFTLRGFIQVNGCRVFAFEKLAEDRTRERFTVSADPALARTYGIRLQELPLLCRAILDRPREDQRQREFAFTEEDMRQFAAAAAARQTAAQSRKPFHRPSGSGSQTGPPGEGQM